jgi:hypothetical protein
MKQSRGRPWKWYRLAHVCRRWRYVLTASPRRLGLQILCKSRTPIEPILDSWPTLPLVVRYKAPKSKTLPDNIIAALRRRDRVREIDLVLQYPLMVSIVRLIQEPFQALECIRLTVKTALRLPMLVPEALLGGSAPRLREVKLEGIVFPFPSMRQLLSSTTGNLVQLCLSELPDTGYCTPDALVTSLSTLVRLVQLTVEFHSPNSPPQSRACPPHQRVILPSLSILSYHGASEYLDQFAAQVDFPALTDVNIELFNTFIFLIPRFCEFISRVDTLKSPTEVMLTPSLGFAALSFVQRGEHGRASGEISLGVSCDRLDWQLSFVTEILNHLSPLLSSVDSLTINKPYKMPFGEGVESTQWLGIFRPFTHVRTIHVFDRIVPDIVDALATEDMATGVLPELTRLYLKGYRKSPSVVKAAEQFVAARRQAGRTVSLFN